ncbi:MAG: YfcE family phosphodiesterase [Gemmataceae bacterium]
MKIGVLSDTHDQVERVYRALALFRDAGVQTLLHCGDITDPATVRAFTGWTAHFVYGNCDWNRAGLAEAIAAIGATNHERFGHLEVEGVALAFLHGDDADLFDAVKNSGAYAFVFHGHTHVAHDRAAGPMRVINPGALHRAARKSVLVLDLPSGEATSLTVE